jgi:menaquinone-dependent protoporphyrinogen oxidase
MSAGARVLVTAASRHGATRGIAEAIARRIPECPAGREAGLTAVSLPADRHPDPAPYTAVVLGSAVYAGRWLDPARDYASAHAATLRDRPVWLFSSGPIGQPPYPQEDPYDALPLAALTGARGHAVFAGRLEPGLLSFPERAMVTAMRAPVGDFRDWDAVARFADAIAADLVREAAAAHR